MSASSTFYPVALHVDLAEGWSPFSHISPS